MTPLVRQIYTTFSLVAMIPAVIWAASAAGVHDLSKVIGGFPFYYLAVCQVLVAPRYVFGAIILERLSWRYKRLNLWAGMVGLFTSGIVVDVVLIVWFARAIGDVSHAKPFMIPFVVLPVGFAMMLLIGLIAGLAVRRGKLTAASVKHHK